MPNNDNFRWRAKRFHLTYKSLITKDVLLSLLTAFTTAIGNNVLAWSIVHEMGNTDYDYEHTHLAWIWRDVPNARGSRRMDFQSEGGQWIHPNIGINSAINWMKHIFLRYHFGYKKDPITGKEVYKAPIAGPWQEFPPNWQWNVYTVEEVANAPNLIAGVNMAGITPRSVGDVSLLQKAAKHRRIEECMSQGSHYTRDQFRQDLDLPTEWVNGTINCLQIWGPVNTGKTNWALAQFERPLHVTSKDALRYLTPEHDGIVFDKMTFTSDWTLDQCEVITDFEHAGTFHIRYDIVVIFARLKKIVVTNQKNVWPSDPDNRLVGRRVVQYEVTEKLFH